MRHFIFHDANSFFASSLLECRDEPETFVPNFSSDLGETTKKAQFHRFLCRYKYLYVNGDLTCGLLSNPKMKLNLSQNRNVSMCQPLEKSEN